MLMDIYRVLKTGAPYQDTGAEEANERATKRKERSMIRLLEKAGYEVVRTCTSEIAAA
jgi:hypothetical protein